VTSLVDALNGRLPRLQRWCTPTLLPAAAAVADPYLSEASCSVDELGDPLARTGAFARLEALAARGQGADGCLLGVHGSTGGNWVIARALALQTPGATVLVARDSHQSVIHACQAFGLTIAFLPGGWHEPTHTLLASTPEEVRAELADGPPPAALWLTSPGYDGAIADVAALAGAARGVAEDPVVVVDEAWGAHLEALGLTGALRAGADVTVRSMHKLGGALAQTAVVAWTGTRLDPALLEMAWRQYTTTSPSYGLLANLEAALHGLDSPQGATQLRRAVGLAAELRERLAGLGIACLTAEDLPADRARGVDPLKVTAAVPRGLAVARGLAGRGVIAEKAGLAGVTFVAAYHLDDDAPALVADALEAVLAEGTQDPVGLWNRNLIADLPRRARAHGPARTREARDLAAAVGAVAGETVEAYPPGIPILVDGFEITAGAVDHLRALAAGGAQVIATDPTLGTLQVRT
jgi:lysine decarboxylase